MQADFKQVLRYGLTGVLTLGLYSVLNATALFVFGMPPGLAAGLAIATAALFNFLMHRHFTFKAQRAMPQSLARYLTLVGFNTVAGSAIVMVAAGPIGMSVVLANLLCLALITLLSFIVLSRLVI